MPLRKRPTGMMMVNDVFFSFKYESLIGLESQKGIEVKDENTEL